MDLVTGIELHDGEATAKAIGPNDRCVLFPVEELGKRGLLSPRTTNRSVTTNLDDWRPVTFDEYAFGVGRNAVNAQHGAWAFTDGQSRIVVPALALMRALFRPHPTLLPRLFRAQSLEDLCSFDPTLAQPGVRLERIIANASENLTLAKRLSWFACFPSARAAWASIHLHARAGRLDMLLPRASIKLMIHCAPQGRGAYVHNSYVTGLTICSVQIQEAPFDFAAAHERSIDFLSAGAASELTTGIEASAQRLGPTYQPLSDEEWEVIRHVLARPNGTKVTRGQVDAALHKLISGIPWRKLPYAPGVLETNVVNFYYRCKADGRLGQVVETLAQMRANRKT
jgi:hypothetical protein